MATGFFSGKIPVAPGTFGTLAALPYVLVLAVIPPAVSGFYITAVILAAIFFAHQAAKILNAKDPGAIVIDEIAGFLVTLSLVPVTVYTFIIGFFIFRFFDITKLPPVKYFEDNFNGGAGIVLDDIMAGIFSAIILKLIYISGIF